MRISVRTSTGKGTRNQKQEKNQGAVARLDADTSNSGAGYLDISGSHGMATNHLR